VTAAALLVSWRKARHLSQLELSAAAGVSQRHLSFLETGRSSASREMIIHLAIELDVPLRDRNTWLRAAGYADAYTHNGLDHQSMVQVKGVLQTMLDAHEPFPAYVVDRTWTMLMSNTPARALTSLLIDPEVAQSFQGNLLRLVMHPDGLRQHIVNWPILAGTLLHRLKRELAERNGDQDITQLLEEIMGYPGLSELPSDPGLPASSDLLVPMIIATPLGNLSFLTTIATIGAPYDVTLEELRLETLLPADKETGDILRSLGE
jgi:transcriptional regulator with XRE-family HTH domain